MGGSKRGYANYIIGRHANALGKTNCGFRNRLRDRLRNLESQDLKMRNTCHFFHNVIDIVE